MNLAQFTDGVGSRQRDNALRPLLALIAGETPIGSKDRVRLTITFDSENVNLRELSAYTSLIDRCFGRLTSDGGLATYSRRRREQVAARSIKAGSIVVELIELAASPEGRALVIIWLLLKYAPQIIKALPEGAKQLAEAYSAFEDGRLKRENRRQIRQQMQHDALVGMLDKPAQEKIIPLLERLLERESSLIPAAGRFADNSVKALDITVLRREAEDKTQG